eukprot:CAMPEP_0196804376 /NCGR_PEP_ID=MMETSP1362-20130617/3974_1 /TAXON_ID=163516 /ORGANISM="Leptocylindrus danicus, Strain CCMP1856" /LENGTH=217 /DNA_ID=CAMNT_0042176635 /DNA_START=35 /DNA_END=688 /DNA_ORIENTATION=+
MEATIITAPNMNPEQGTAYIRRHQQLSHRIMAQIQLTSHILCMNVRKLKQHLRKALDGNAAFIRHANSVPKNHLQAKQYQKMVSPSDRWRSILRIEAVILQSMPDGECYTYRNEVVEVAQCIECIFFRYFKHTCLYCERDQHALLNCVLRIARGFAKKIERETSVQALVKRTMMERDRARQEEDTLTGGGGSSSLPTSSAIAPALLVDNPWSFAAAA